MEDLRVPKFVKEIEPILSKLPNKKMATFKDQFFHRAQKLLLHQGKERREGRNESRKEIKAEAVVNTPVKKDLDPKPPSFISSPLHTSGPSPSKVVKPVPKLAPEPPEIPSHFIQAPLHSSQAIVSISRFLLNIAHYFQQSTKETEIFLPHPISKIKRKKLQEFNINQKI